MLDLVGLALWLLLLALLLPRPWLAARSHLTAIVILRVPLLVLAIAWLLHRNDQMREILAITYFSASFSFSGPGSVLGPGSWHLIVAILSYLLVASSLWFWTGVFCDLHSAELKSRRWAYAIPSAFLAIVVYNVGQAAPGGSTGLSLLLAGLCFGVAYWVWAIGDDFFHRGEAFASQDFLGVAGEYFTAMGIYFGALADWIGSRVPTFNPLLAIVGALASLVLAPFVAIVILLGWASRAFNAIMRTVARVAGKPSAEEPAPCAPASSAQASRPGATAHPWWLDWIFWLDRSLTRLNASYVKAINPAPHGRAPMATDVGGGLGLWRLARPPSMSNDNLRNDNMGDALRSSAPTLISALVLASGPLALVLAPEFAATWLFQLYLYAAIGIGGTLLFCAAWAFFAGLLMPSCALLLFILVPGVAVHTVGEIGVIALCNAFLLACLALFCLLWLLGRALDRPVMAILAGGLLLLSYFDLNDNHAIRAVDSPVASTPPKVGVPLSESAGTTPVSPALLAAFDAWLAARKDRADFAGGYPVYIVAARGGGMYAAQHTARFLARAQDLYPGFAHHVFAISAVSGGSVGAALFTSLVKERQRQHAAPQRAAAEHEHWFENHANAFLDNDLLASVTAATLFRDTVARLLPCLDITLWRSFRLCPTEHLDRARAFDETLERTWDTRAPHSGAAGSTKANPFRAPFSQHWSPTGDAPALLLNTTEVETGDRVIVAPFKLENADIPSLVSLMERAPELNVALSTAAGLSARFPGLASAGSYLASTTGGKAKRRLVDGGYFDNSGVATALDVVNVIRRQRPDIRFVLIALTGADTETAQIGYGFGELLSPLRTLEGIRKSRADLAMEQAHLTLDGSPCRMGTQGNPAPCAYDGSVRQSVLASGDQQLPLGWFLSKRSRDKIAWSVGEPGLCGAIASPPHALAAASPRERLAAHVRASNGCVLRTIGEELGGRGRKPR